MNRWLWASVVAWSGCLGISGAMASIDTVPGDGLPETEPGALLESSRISPSELFKRTERVLRSFQIADEPDSSEMLRDLVGTQTQKGAQKILPWLDPKTQLGRFVELSPQSLEAFQDRDSRELRDFGVDLAPNAHAMRSAHGLTERLQTFAKNPEDRPLHGIKIALDPGHMGGKEWDERTGKYVKGPGGQVVSEGVLNLQVCLLLEAQLKKLGAKTLVTHRGLSPVTGLPLKSLSIENYGRRELRSRALDPWFQSLLESASEAKELHQAFVQSSQVQKIFSENARDNYFILRADLDARAAMIEKFDPDITLIIHFDANELHLNPAGTDATKAYVFGSMAPTEFATRESRLLFADHLLDQESWDASLRLTRQVVQNLHQGLKIELEKPTDDNVVVIEPGVLTRNLHLSRHLTGHAVTYVEVLRYDAPAEFNAIAHATHRMMIDGVDHPYSDRIDLVAKSLSTAVVGFVAGYKNE